MREAKTLNHLGFAYQSRSQYEKAITYYQQALPIFQQVKDRNGEAKVLNHLGIAYQSLSQYEKAIAYYQQALPIFQQVKDRKGEAKALNNLGLAYQSRAQYEKLSLLDGQLTAKDAKALERAGSRRYIEGQSPVDSLAHPYYWAPFIVIGNSL